MDERYFIGKGEWVWIAEADDLCEPTFLETCVKQVQKYPNVSVCMTASRYIDEKVIYYHKKPIIGGRRSRLYLLVGFRERLMQSITCIGIVVLPMPVAYCFAVLMLPIYPILLFKHEIQWRLVFLVPDAASGRYG